jgi:hypothetical protein
MLLSYQSIAKAELPPIRTWGDLSTIYQDQYFNNDMSHATDWLTTATINASSYVWHPWFALVNGSLSFTRDTAEASVETPIRNEYIDGRFNLNLFPRSRFPSLFYASKSQNELDDKVFGKTITNTTIGMQQQYRSRDGKQSYNGNIERNKRDGLDQDSVVIDTVGFSARYQLEKNTFFGDIDYNNASKPNEDDATNHTLTGRHSYEGNRNLTWENLASTTQTHSDFVNNITDTKNDQISSFLSWRPAGRSDLNITGNFRISELEQTSEQIVPGSPNAVTQIEQPAVNLNQGLIYRYNPRITITESVNLNQTKTAGNDLFTGSESAGISYDSDSAITSLGYYTWNAAATFIHSHGSNIDSNNILNNSLGHSLSKDIKLSPTITVQSSFNQSVGYLIDPASENTDSLNHSITLNWSESSRNNSSSIRFSASDARNHGLDENKFQLLNLQISNDYRLSRYAHLIANLTLQDSVVTTEERTSKSQFYNGQINFTNNRFLNIRALRFESNLSFNQQDSSTRDDFVTDDDSASENSWENELIYRIGLFESRLNLDLVKKGNAYDRIIRIQLIRNFGDL